MGTYTTNYNLFMPSIGEQGWGDLVNGNFVTIDTIMSGLNTRLTAVETEVNGNLSCTSVATSSTITSTGKITANGGIGTKALTTTSISNSGNMTNTGTLTCTGKIYANGGIEGAASSLNKDITVTPSTNNTMRIRASVNALPYIPGATYTGTIRIQAGSGSTIIVYFMSSSGAMSSESIAASVDKTITIPDNTIYAYVDHSANYANSYSTYYAPLFS